ncbi:ABC transporter permease [Paenibacillus thalictri]|uniref:ABC transporter permease n=1 Tax=Paenibacillus thalictri TaxID=2527873 RepID=A0A4Q9DKG9_9BACL|nr:ABC transporter permease [Paenibacillus thalictri]TBL75273.1 ABC transporter permease [Paenibacillus thalictri]
MSNQVEALQRAAGQPEKAEASQFAVKLKERWSTVWIGAALPVVLLAVWQLLGELGVVSPVFLPTPVEIAGSFGQLIATGELQAHLAISLERAATGFLIGGVFGLLTGFVVGFSQKAEYLIDPSMQMLRMIPHLAVAPLIILWFGFGESSKVFIIASGAFFPLYINTFLGIRSVDNKLFDVASVLGFSKTKQIFRLILPASLPHILLGLRLSVAISWLGLVVAELIGSQAGVGFLINFGKQTSGTDLIFVGVIVFAVIGMAVDLVFRWLDTRLLAWRDHFQG